MKSYSDFLSEIDAATEARVSDLLENTCSNLNGAPSVICSSSNPEDIKLVRVVEVEQPENCW